MSKTKLKLVLIVCFIAGAFVLARQFDFQHLVRRALEWIAALGVWAPIIFIALYIVASVLFLPGFLLTLGAGVVFGVVRGTIIVSIAATLGATAAFLVGRYLARDWVAARIESNPRFKAIDEAVAHEGWKIVGLTRLSPIFPFILLNYAFGLTRVSFREYVLASWIGMLPATIMYVYIGSLAGSVAQIGTAQRSRSTAEWVFSAAGLVATVVVTVFVTRVARRALDKRIAS